MNRNIFPLIKIEYKNWSIDEVLEELITSDAYIYSSNDKVYHKYWKGQLFSDFNGYLYRVVDQKKKTGFIHDILRHFPLSPSSKIELQFRLTGEKMSFESLKKYLINCVNKLEDEEVISLKKDLKNASRYHDLKEALKYYIFYKNKSYKSSSD